MTYILTGPRPNHKYMLSDLVSATEGLVGRYDPRRGVVENETNPGIIAKLREIRDLRQEMKQFGANLPVHMIVHNEVEGTGFATISHGNAEITRVVNTGNTAKVADLRDMLMGWVDPDPVPIPDDYLGFWVTDCMSMIDRIASGKEMRELDKRAYDRLVYMRKEMMLLSKKREPMLRGRVIGLEKMRFCLMYDNKKIFALQNLPHSDTIPFSKMLDIAVGFLGSLRTAAKALQEKGDS